MSQVTLNKKVPDFSCVSTSELMFKLSENKGSNVLVYFYPKDSTSGCTREGQDIRDNYAKFKRNKTVVVGVSRDSIKSHEKFKSNENFPFELLADTDEKLCTLFDVIKEKNMYGKKVMGVQRSTFLIDTTGKLQREWRKVKVDGHIDEVLDAIRELNRKG